MKTLYTLLLLGLDSFLLFTSCFAQGKSAQADTSHQASAVGHAVSVYHQAMSQQAHLFNGSEYLDYNQPKRGHQFFKTREWEDGTITYDGIVYPKLPMLYDLVKDLVVIGHFDETGTSLNIRLNKERVQRFTLQGHTFVRIVGDSSNSTSVAAGFYDLLYDGQVKVLAKRQKKYQQSVEDRHVILVFSSKDRYYIRVGDQYHLVKSKGSALKVFQEHRKELVRYLRQHKHNFSDDRELALVALAEQYDALTK
jgi:hypothetical protein